MKTIHEEKYCIVEQDIAGILNMSTNDSPLSIYLKIKGLYPRCLEENNNRGDCDPLYWGKVLGQLIQEKFENANQVQVEKSNKFIQHKKYDYLGFYFNKFISKEKTGVRCKCVGSFQSKEWKDEIPMKHIYETQYAMFMTDFDTWVYAVLIGGNTYKQFIIKRDQKLIDIIIKKLNDFWENNVLKNIPPKPVLNDMKIVNNLYNDELNLEDIIEMNNYENLVAEVFDMKDTLKKLEEMIEERQIQIKEIMKENCLAHSGSYAISWKPQTRNFFDSKRFKLENEDLYNKYSQERESRVFRIKSLLKN